MHVVTTAPVEEGLVLSPSSSRPPEVQLCRTFLGEIRAGHGSWGKKKRRAEWKKRVVVCWADCGGVLKKNEYCPAADDGDGRVGSFVARTVAESRIEPQSWRPSWVVVALEVIVERHAVAAMCTSGGG